MPIKIYTVKEITFQIRDILEGNFYGLWVKGEISSLRQSTTGHVYFNLVDDVATLGCIIYKNQLPNITVKLENGKQVVAYGSLGVYVKGGEYRLKVEHLQEQGVGKRHYDFEKLKKEFKAKGYFDRKRPIPLFPQRILLITSPTGAAIRDIIKIISRRSMGMEILVLPISVQGETAKPSILEALTITNSIDEKIDVVVLARGGGSEDDLWIFNDPDIVKALFNVKFPTISAIGHEVDFTLCDFVADKRAETPSAAAEILTKSRENTLEQISNLKNRISLSIKRIINSKQQQLQLFSSKNNYNRIMSLIDNRIIYIDRLADNLQVSINRLIDKLNHKVIVIREQIVKNSPQTKIQLTKQRVNYVKDNLEKSVSKLLKQKENRIELLKSKIQYLSPLNILQKGYSITTNEEGKIIKNSHQVEPNQKIKTRLAKGEIISTVKLAK